MEYSKEDLMEAKRQIWGVGENMGTEESKKIWEENAQFWDNAMGDESNEKKVVAKCHNLFLMQSYLMSYMPLTPSLRLM